MSYVPPSDNPQTPPAGTQPAAGPPRGTDYESSSTPAVRGAPRGESAWTGATNGVSLASFLGWFSIGVGALELLAPAATARMIGIRPTGKSTAVLRSMGVREIATGAGILANPTSKEWVGMRIGGDLLDLAMLGAAVANAERPGRTLLAAAAVLGVSALDVAGTEGLAQRRQSAMPEDLAGAPAHARRSITVDRPRAEVFGFWRDFTNFPRFMEHLKSVEMLDAKRSRWRATGPGGSTVEWESQLLEERDGELIAWRSTESSALYNAGTVRFDAAPGGSATVVTVQMEYAPPGGKVGAAIAKLFRKEPGQQIGDDLRRFKQVLETGEVLLSDASAVGAFQPARPPQRSELH